MMKLPFFTLLLLISFASVNAVLFTPALPTISEFFQITAEKTELTITLFLVGYALCQLIYGPLANRYGRKPILVAGITLQIVSSLLCVLSSILHYFWILILGRFLLAMGSGVGLKMTFTMISECYEPKAASKKISYLMLAFAITPGLGVALGGFLITHFDWSSCFWAGMLYGLVLLILASRLPETSASLDLNALKYDHLTTAYKNQFSNMKMVVGSVLMGSTSCFIYLFATIGPFIAMNYFNMTSAEYGIANILPPIGLIVGSLLGPYLVNHFSLLSIMKAGIVSASIGTFLMLLAIKLKFSVFFALFIPLIVIYFGLCLIMPNISTLTMSQVKDKAHGSAVMNFINLSVTTMAVLGVGHLSMSIWLLPTIYLFLCIAMTMLFIYLSRLKLSN